MRPPALFDLGSGFDAALRPVHIRNIGPPRSEPPDAFWGGIHAAVGVDGVRETVESFVDGQRLRAYSNWHGLAVNPARGCAAAGMNSPLENFSLGGMRPAAREKIHRDRLER